MRKTHGPPFEHKRMVPKLEVLVFPFGTQDMRRGPGETHSRKGQYANRYEAGTVPGMEKGGRRGRRRRKGVHSVTVFQRRDEGSDHESDNLQVYCSCVTVHVAEGWPEAGGLATNLFVSFTTATVEHSFSRNTFSPRILYRGFRRGEGVHESCPALSRKSLD
jgi:hypothetical protein